MFTYNTHFTYGRPIFCTTNSSVDTPVMKCDRKFEKQITLNDTNNKFYFIIRISFNKLLFICYFKSWSVSCTYNFTVSMVNCPTL